jgi:hypothetical protein
MSALLGAAALRHRRTDVRRFGPVVLIPLLLVMLAVGAASAERPTAVLRISAIDAARSGSLIGILPHPVGSSSLVEVQAPGAVVLLAVSADGAQAALADQVGQLSGSLTLAHADGSQLRLPLPGLISAGFSADGSWLAVVDGRGALWRVDATTGASAQIGDGPFLGSPVVAADGSLVLLAVSSVEAPYRSQVVRVAPSTGAVTPLSGDDLDYAGYPLTDGGVAVVSHEPGRIVVRRVAGGASQLIGDLEPGAVNVAVASDGRRIAYELVGRGVVLLDRQGASPSLLGAGSHPCFAADPSSLLVRRGIGTAALALDGSVRAVTQGQAGFAGAVGCLP